MIEKLKDCVREGWQSRISKKENKKKKNLVLGKENNSKLNLLSFMYQISSKQWLKKKKGIPEIPSFTNKSRKEDVDLSKQLV